MNIVEFLATCDVFGVGTEANATFIQIIGTARLVVKVLQILIPIALIVWGTIDLGKAVIAGEDKKIKEGRELFVKRLVAALIVFLVPFVVNLVINLVSQGTWKACYDAAQNVDIRQNQNLKNGNY